MGYVSHHAIIVTGSSAFADQLHAAHKYALTTVGCVSEIVKSPINGYLSFAVFPDGSYEGYPESKKWDEERDSLIAYMKTFELEDGSSPLSWAEVRYGDEMERNGVERCS